MSCVDEAKRGDDKAAAAAGASTASSVPPTPNNDEARKRIIGGIVSPPGPKRATRASTGAPIALTAKGTLYKAHKDTGTSSEDESDRPVSGSRSSGQAGAGSTVSRAPISRSAANTGTGGGRTWVGSGSGGGGRGGGRGGGGSSRGSARASQAAAAGAGAAVAVEPPAADEPAAVPPTAPRRRRGRKGRSIYRGVCVTREGKWRAVIYKERKQLYLGVYESELEAAKAHDRAARFHFPDKSMTNFVAEAEVDRLISGQEQQRRVQEEVDRDLAPLRRLVGAGGRMAAGVVAEGGRGAGGRIKRGDSIRTPFVTARPNWRPSELDGPASRSRVGAGRRASPGDYPRPRGPGSSSFSSGGPGGVGGGRVGEEGRRGGIRVVARQRDERRE